MIGYIFVILPHMHPLAACLYPSSMFIIPTVAVLIHTYRNRNKTHSTHDSTDRNGNENQTNQIENTNSAKMFLFHIPIIFIFLVTFVFLLYRSYFNTMHIDKTAFLTFSIVSGPFISLRWSFPFISKCETSRQLRWSLVIVLLRLVSALTTFCLVFFLFKELTTQEFEYSNFELFESLLGPYNTTRISLSNVNIDEVNFHSNWNIVQNVFIFLVFILCLNLLAVDACRIRSHIFGFIVPLILGEVIYFVFWLVFHHTESSHQIPYFGSMDNINLFGEFADVVSVLICYLLCMVSMFALLYSKGVCSIPDSRLNKPSE